MEVFLLSLLCFHRADELSEHLFRKCGAWSGEEDWEGGGGGGARLGRHRHRRHVLLNTGIERLTILIGNMYGHLCPMSIHQSDNASLFFIIFHFYFCDLRLFLALMICWLNRSSSSRFVLTIDTLNSVLKGLTIYLSWIKGSICISYFFKLTIVLWVVPKYKAFIWSWKTYI